MRFLYIKLMTGWLLLVLVVITAQVLQAKDLSFKSIHIQSLTVKSAQDTLRCNLAANAVTAAQLLLREPWTVGDLDSLECLLGKINDRETPGLYAMYSYIKALAYRNFDDVAFDSLIQDAYFQFQNLNDVEGMFYSQSALLLSLTYTEESVVSGHNIQQLFEKAELLVQSTDYIPVKLAWIELYLKKAMFEKKELPITQLDSLGSYLVDYEVRFPEVVRLSYTVLAIQFQRLKELRKSLDYKFKALALANPNKSDYASFLSNIGGSYFFMGQLDSAKHYLLKAYNKIPDPNRIYLFHIKSNIAQKLGVVYRQLNMPDSANFYGPLFYKLHIKKMELEQNEKLIYSARKFEVKQLALEKAQLDLKIARREQERLILFFAVITIGLLAVVFLFLYFKTKRLEQQKSSLVVKRNKLLQIIGHDLSSPLHALATSAEIIPMLIKNKRFDDLEVVQKSLSLSVEGLKSTIANLFAWNQSHSNKYTNIHETIIPLGDFSRTLVSNYSSLQQILNLTVMLKIESENISIKCDPMYFHQLMRNLLQNALKHSPQNTNIDFNVGSFNQKAVVTICNTFPVDYLPQVEKLAAAYNNRELSAIVAPGLGSELILEAVEKLQVSFSATIKGDEFEVRVEHELA